MKKIITVLTLIVCILCFPACKKGGESLSVYAPDGAPALALSYAMQTVSGFDYNIVGSDVIESKVTGENSVADVAIIPINTASVYLGDGDTYQMLGVVTHGNFYFLSDNEVEINKQNSAMLIGKTIGVIQLANIPGLTLKATLNALDIPFKELKNGEGKDENKVNLAPIKPTEIGVLGYDFYLAPSPVADAKSGALGLKFNGSLHSLYGENGFPQAVIVAKKSVILSNKNDITMLVNAIKESENYLKIENKDSICSLVSSNLESGLTPVFSDKNLTQNAINRANIKFVSASDSKAEINDFLKKIKDVSVNSVETLSEEFFYSGEF